MVKEKTALVLLNDLMFRVKVEDLIRRAGFMTKVYADAGLLLAACREHQPEAVIMDLNYEAASPLQFISDMKADAATKAIPVLAYVSHVQVELRRKAEELGCDLVVARSALVQGLPQFLSEAGNAA